METADSVPNRKEAENQRGIKIADNIGIKRGKDMIDVIADPQAIKDHILSRVAVAKPAFLGKAQEVVDKLTISFGARPYSEILTEQIEEKLANRGLEEGQKRSLAAKVTILLAQSATWFGSSIVGSTDYNENHPSIYINAGGVSNDDKLRDVWDHEVGHFINLLDPINRKEGNQIIEEALKNTALDMGIQLAFTAGETSVIQLTKVVGKRNFTRREFLKGIWRTAFLSWLVTMIPSKLVSNEVKYMQDSDEKEAKNYAKLHQTPISEFVKLIRVVKRG